MAERAANLPAGEDAADKGPSILFVDTDKALADELQQHFSRRNYAFHHLRDPRGISKALSLHRPDLIIMELALGALRGDDIIRALRKREVRIPIVILARSASKDLIMEMRNCNVSGFFIKPVSLATLENRIQAVLAPRKRTGSLVPTALVMSGNRKLTALSFEVLPLSVLKEYGFNTVFAFTPQEAVNILTAEKNNVRIALVDANDQPFVESVLRLLQIIDKRMNIPLYLFGESLSGGLKQQLSTAGIENVVDKSSDSSKTRMGQFQNELLSHHERIHQKFSKKRELIIQHVKNISSLPPMPDIYLRVEALASEPDTTVADYGKVLELDPSITARLLRMSNSALYSFKRRINSVRDAVALMGTREILSLVRLACITGNLRTVPELDKYVKMIWRHSATCAIAAKQIYQHLPIFSEKDLDEELFIGGIIHDIGKIVLAKVSPDAFLSYARTADHSIHWNPAEEKVVTGVDHCDIGMRLADHWKLPDHFREVIAYHHAPEYNYDADLLKAICLANVIAHGITQHFSADYAEEIDPEFLKRNNLTNDDLTGFVAKYADSIFEKADILTQMITGQ